MSFGDKLRKAREERKMTVSALAKATGFTVSYISRIETGQRKPPTLKIIKKLADVLGLPIELLTSENAYLPFDVLDKSKIPTHVLEWIMKEGTMPYIELGMKAYNRKLPADKADAAIEFATKFIENDKK